MLTNAPNISNAKFICWLGLSADNWANLLKSDSLTGPHRTVEPAETSRKVRWDTNEAAHLHLANDRNTLLMGSHEAQDTRRTWRSRIQRPTWSNRPNTYTWTRNSRCAGQRWTEGVWDYECVERMRMEELHNTAGCRPINWISNTVLQRRSKCWDES